LRGAFHKISRVSSLIGATKWYLSDDCLLSAKHMMYAVEYRRFYLRDIESITVWPNRLWLLRPMIPGLLFGVAAAMLWYWANPTAGEIAMGAGVLCVAVELAPGPTAKSRIRTSGATVDLPIVKRTRRAQRVLAEIDAAIRNSRGGAVEPVSAAASAPQPAAGSTEFKPETAPAAARIGDLT
jgi:hypothetical protein